MHRAPPPGEPASGEGQSSSSSRDPGSAGGEDQSVKSILARMDRGTIVACIKRMHRKMPTVIEDLLRAKAEKIRAERAADAQATTAPEQQEKPKRQGKTVQEEPAGGATKTTTLEPPSKRSRPVEQEKHQRSRPVEQEKPKRSVRPTQQPPSKNAKAPPSEAMIDSALSTIDGGFLMTTEGSAGPGGDALDFSNGGDMMEIRRMVGGSALEMVRRRRSAFGRVRRRIGSTQQSSSAASRQNQGTSSSKSADHFLSWDALGPLMLSGAGVPTWKCRSTGTPPTRPSGSKLLEDFSEVVRATAAEPGKGGRWCEALLAGTLGQPKNGVRPTDAVILVPPRLSTAEFSGTRICVHLAVLGAVPGDPWGIRDHTPQAASKTPYEIVVEASGHTVAQAVQFSYTGQVGYPGEGGEWCCDDCGPLYVLASSMGYESLRLHLELHPPPLDRFSECMAMATILSLDQGRRGLKLTSEFDVVGFCGEAQSAPCWGDAAVGDVQQRGLVACLERVPLFVIEHLMYPSSPAVRGPRRSVSTDPVSRAKFLELWSTSNYAGLVDAQRETRDEIVQLVSGLQLPAEYVRAMLEPGGSNLVPVCARTPSGKAFLQGKLKYLEICDEDSDLNSVSYDVVDSACSPLTTSAQQGYTGAFEFSGDTPDDVLRPWPGGRLVAGGACVMTACRSYSRLAFDIGSSAEGAGGGGAPNFCDLPVWNYGPDAYVIPVWDSPAQEGAGAGGIVYAVIRDEAIDAMARMSTDWDSLDGAEHSRGGDSFDEISQLTSRAGPGGHCWFSRQVCLIISGGMGASEGSTKVLDFWEIPNSEEFAPRMMWSGAYTTGRFLVGWAPHGSAVFDCYRGVGCTGDLYVLEGSAAAPRVTRGVCLSQPGCFCVLEGLEGMMWIIYVDPEGQVFHVRMSGGSSTGAVRYGFNVGSGALGMCSVPRTGEVAVLFKNKVCIYLVSPDPPCCDGVPQFNGSLYSIPFGGGGASASAGPALGVHVAVCPRTMDLYVMDESCTVYYFKRRQRGRKETVDKFFEGDTATVSLNPGLGDRWKRLIVGVLGEGTGVAAVDGSQRDSGLSGSAGPLPPWPGLLSIRSPDPSSPAATSSSPVDPYVLPRASWNLIGRKKRAAEDQSTVPVLSVPQPQKRRSRP